ncbi:MAG: hypothetical protein ABJH06_10470 [Paraglaciecola sp.]|uniref:hypothetical protein n=1 Tax=Paraglaciecola sp. TaxID=1920173 RepID=UPI0032970A42
MQQAISRQRTIGTQDNYEENSDLIQYFGYNTERKEHESPFELPEEGLCCMVSSVNRDIQREINAKLDFPLLKLGKGQWVITANVGTEVKFSGPYDSDQLAMESAKEKFGAIRFMSTPEIF